MRKSVPKFPNCKTSCACHHARPRPAAQRAKNVVEISANHEFHQHRFETANPSRVSICAAGMAVFEDGKLTETPYWLVRPPKGKGWFDEDFIEIHHLTHLDVLDAPEFPPLRQNFWPG